MSDKEAWRAYYSEKRVGHQWTQLDLLSTLPAQRVLEVGPHLGFVTALLDNMGYEVSTLDMREPAFERPRVPHRIADLRTLEAETVAGVDAILCCECLEHLPWEDASAALRTFHEGARGTSSYPCPTRAFRWASRSTSTCSRGGVRSF